MGEGFKKGERKGGVVGNKKEGRGKREGEIEGESWLVEFRELLFLCANKVSGAGEASNDLDKS